MHFKCTLFRHFHLSRHTLFGPRHCATPIIALSSELLGVNDYFCDGGFHAVDDGHSIAIFKVVLTYELFVGLKLVIHAPDANNKLLLV